MVSPFKFDSWAKSHLAGMHHRPQVHCGRRVRRQGGAQPAEHRGFALPPSHFPQVGGPHEAVTAKRHPDAPFKDSVIVADGDLDETPDVELHPSDDALVAGQLAVAITLKVFVQQPVDGRRGSGRPAASSGGVGHIWHSRNQPERYCHACARPPTQSAFLVGATTVSPDAVMVRGLSGPVPVEDPLWDDSARSPAAWLSQLIVAGRRSSIELVPGADAEQQPALPRQAHARVDERYDDDAKFGCKEPTGR